MAETKHLELYKAHRPRTWKQLVGQTKTANSLKNAVAQNKVPTAYGFFGERGCGKTSAAFILAKAVNCVNVENGNPCNTCDTCINIDNGTQIGVRYESMANKGGVADVKKLVDDANLSVQIKRQVFILDEIHNIHKAAFDALLIPLEKANMQALFILCSTEIHKIPQTILSRIQSRKFYLVDSETMTKYMKYIVKKDDLTIDEESITAAVRMGRGSVRDTLSSLETVIETGEASTTYSGKLLNAIAAQDLGQTLAVVAEAAKDNVSGRDLGEQLFEDLRDLFLVASGADASLMPTIPVDNEEAAIKGLLGTRGLGIALDEIGDSLTRMSLGADSRIHLEIAIVDTLKKFKQLKARAAQAKA